MKMGKINEKPDNKKIIKPVFCCVMFSYMSLKTCFVVHLYLFLLNRI